MKMGVLVWFYAFLFQLHIVFSFIHPAVHLCSNDETHALIKFKQMFTIYNYTVGGCDETQHPKTMSWNHSTDCCTWDGVTCDRFTGRVIGLDLNCSQLSGENIHLNSSISHLSHLQKLNLANNYIWGKNIFREIAPLRSLMYLDLSGSFYTDILRPEIWLLSNLTKLRILSLAQVDLSSEVSSSFLNLSKSLVHLDLSSSGVSGDITEEFFRHFPYLETLSLANNMLSGHFLPNYNWSNVSFLKKLDLSQTYFSGEIPESIGTAKSLNYLDLSQCGFSGSLPNSIGNLSRIIKMDLSFNNFSGQIPSSISNLDQISYLDLSVNNFKSEIPDVFMHLKSLTFLSLAFNNLFGPFPSSAANLSEVLYIDLSKNSLSGCCLPQIATGLQKLTYFSLSNNSLTGSLPSWLFNLPSLNYILLDYNQFTGKISEFKSKKMWGIYLNNNKLSGQIPQPFSKSAFFIFLYISSNNFSGVVDLSMFPNTIIVLDMSGNNLKWSNRNNEQNNTFPILTTLRLSSCDIKEIPSFIQYSNILQTLDLSENKIHGRIPDWFRSTKWEYLFYLDLSHNYLTVLDKFPWKSLQFLHLKSNMLQGTLPTHICELDELSVLDLSNNNLSGKIPSCFGNFSSQLMVLDLRRNHFHGSIPTNFQESNQLKNIALNGNQLQGSIPRTLLNCQQLEVLDLGNNFLTNEFPSWLENLQELQVLILKSNKFHGPIPGFNSENPFPKVRIFDISYNNFSGKFPEKIFTSFKAMMNQDDHGEEEGLPIYREMKDVDNNLYYRDSLSLVIKGNEMEISRVLITLSIIDLSSNNFVGDIPKLSIGNLKGLKLLNLSHNRIQGQIPSSLGELRKLESLDLSSNQLEGEIPWQLTKLTYISFLNLSGNRLTGRIPQGNQFQTFRNNSFTGNLALCGFPLTRACRETNPAVSQTSSYSRNGHENADEDFVDGFSWRAVVIGYGCGVVLGVSIGCAMFLTGKPKWYNEIVDRTISLKGRTRKRNGRKGRKLMN